ncbi:MULTISPECIES: lysozyme inhibitor LprI family protein [unclassified Inquilinus]|uniref:lysozyme inhibitor LprI family protein n=1 Tax=unclassified Inquilinus TaxID=2645927 RepID=UPI003F913CF5
MDQMSICRIFGYALLILSAASSLGQAQEDPSFDCAKARTHVEKVLCSGGNSGMGWIDQTMADLYQAVHQAPGADAAALQASQRAWLVQRNHCSGSDEKVMNCLLDSYRARYVELSAPYDQHHLTGSYSNDRVGGFLDGVLFPDGSLSVSISSTGPAPAYDQCSVTFRAPLDGGKVHYVAPPDPDIPDSKCTVDLTVSGSEIRVVPTDCRESCGNGASFDGVYKR